MNHNDQIQRFLFDDTDVRGVLTRLNTSYADVLKCHPYPLPVQVLLGEMLAAVSLLSSTLKFEGRLSLQARGDGALSLLMAECTHQHDLRAIARWNAEGQAGEGLTELLGHGQLVITIEPDKGKRYQGIVALDQPSLSACLEAYFLQSEQLATRILLAADGECAAGLLLQTLPAEQHDERYQEDWARITHLGLTLSSQELLTLENDTLLHRLFHEEEVRLFDPEPLRFACDCSRDRSLEALKAVGRDELEDLLREQGLIEMDCQFCGEHYAYDTTDIAQLFSDSAGIDPSASCH